MKNKGETVAAINITGTTHSVTTSKQNPHVHIKSCASVRFSGDFTYLCSPSPEAGVVLKHMIANQLSPQADWHNTTIVFRLIIAEPKGDAHPTPEHEAKERSKSS